MMPGQSSGPFPLIFGASGFALLAVGLWFIYPPASLIATGLLLMALGFLGRRGAL